MWSAIGLPIALAVGFEHFERAPRRRATPWTSISASAPLEQNLPVILALLGVWYRNFFGAETHAVLPYDQYLHRFAAYFQQGDMESNGKSVDRDGSRVDYATGPVIWGEPGTNGQHAFYQLIHQGTRADPVRLPRRRPRATTPWATTTRSCSPTSSPRPRRSMVGKTGGRGAGRARRRRASRARRWRRSLPHKVFEGNRPTNSILLPEAHARSALGSLIALYEHKIFVQGIDLEHQQLRPVGRGARQAAGQDDPAGASEATSRSPATTPRPTA